MQQRLQNFLLTYRSTPHATPGFSPCKLFLNRELRTRLTLTKPDLARRVLDQQGKMKHHHDAHAKPREMAVGDDVLARNHQISQKWQPGIVLERTVPLSYRVQLNDGRVWRRRADVFLNSPNSNTTNQEAVQPEPAGPETQSTNPPDPEPPATAETDSPPPSMPEPAECATNENAQPRRSGRTVKPQQRLIEKA